jgi:hypothetical protein
MTSSILFATSVLPVPGGNSTRGLFAWDTYVDWSEVELCKVILLCHVFTYNLASRV